MNITALYKVFRGREFFEASLKSIYNHVDKIVIVSSEISWTGETGNNTREVAETFPDPLKKIFILKHDTKDQLDQYRVGMQHIKLMHGCDWVLLIDSDEVWDEASWEIATETLWNSTREINGYSASMHTYIKEVKFRVDDSKNLQVRPMVFIRPSVSNFGIRGNGVTPWRYIPGIYIHHFALVRDSVEEVFAKFRTSQIGDKHQPGIVDLDKWKAEVWDKIPGPAYHYYRGCEQIWEKTIEVTNEDLPVTVRK